MQSSFDTQPLRKGPNVSAVRAMRAAFLVSLGVIRRVSPFIPGRKTKKTAHGFNNPSPDSPHLTAGYLGNVYLAPGIERPMSKRAMRRNRHKMAV